MKIMKRNDLWTNWFIDPCLEVEQVTSAIVWFCWVFNALFFEVSAVKIFILKLIGI